MEQLADADGVTVNTTTRYNHYCKARTKDGRKCSLYQPHEGLHKTNHGHSYFGEDEVVNE